MAVIPPLKAGAVVLADRYIYTAFARDVVRVRQSQVGSRSLRLRGEADGGLLLSHAPGRGDEKNSRGRDAIKYYEAGMDIGLSENIEESFRLFQSRIIDEYEKNGRRIRLVAIDATRSIEEQQTEVRKIVSDALAGTQEIEGSTMARFSFFGEGLPEINLEELKGKLIVLEGTDGVGRSTHIGLLKAMAGKPWPRRFRHRYDSFGAGGQAPQASQGRPYSRW